MEIAIGPIHSAMLEPHRLRLVVEDEIIKDAEITIGVNYRGIELIMEGLPPEKISILSEKICGICSHIHVWTNVMVVEKGCDIEVPERAEYIRIIVEELERLHSHTLLFGHIYEVLGFETMAYRAFMVREPILKILQEITGGRVQYSCPIIGGVRPRCNIQENKIPSILERLEKFEEDLKKLLKRTFNDPMILARIKEVGYLDKETAKKFHATGPTARGSGIRSDMRKLLKVSLYDRFEFDEVLFDEGDVYARLAVRFYECFESLKIIRQALKDLPNLDKKIYNPNYELKPFDPIDVYNEAQRGQVYYSYGLDENLRVKHVKVRTPTATNLACMEAILPGHNVSDAELIIVSCDPCFTCTDRMIVIKESSP
ncbi:NADH dehydrogenase (ubiquinone), 30 kDa subunit [Methanocaldococcus villosus KIN24-T80]|uniref:NADH dehydrogenase (Ubiquinone), 30 kDa subunit n=1 Tax=Methanocaldococcus villosus KIN24-T80 TaxID=1069083 RepID=N6V2F3_9EURY|nr:nickel-dependent hydrogenase large subunit [Methanocaldococcus villosus]ENN96443.1 NADH dehydrogenase (ubiquinone), 30 kDa subunit [Methanocaldococcus villosus KIN24-T80]